MKNEQLSRPETRNHVELTGRSASEIVADADKEFARFDALLQRAEQLINEIYG